MRTSPFILKTKPWLQEVKGRIHYTTIMLPSDRNVLAHMWETTLYASFTVPVGSTSTKTFRYVSPTAIYAPPISSFHTDPVPRSLESSILAKLDGYHCTGSTPKRLDQVSWKKTSTKNCNKNGGRSIYQRYMILSRAMICFIHGFCFTSETYENDLGCCFCTFALYKYWKVLP